MMKCGVYTMHLVNLTVISAQTDDCSLVSRWTAAFHCQRWWKRSRCNVEYIDRWHVIVPVSVDWRACLLFDIFSENRTPRCSWV